MTEQQAKACATKLAPFVLRETIDDMRQNVPAAHPVGNDKVPGGFVLEAKWKEGGVSRFEHASAVDAWIAARAKDAGQ